MIISDSSATSFGEDFTFISAAKPPHFSGLISYIAVTVKPFLSKFLQTASPETYPIYTGFIISIAWFYIENIKLNKSINTFYIANKNVLAQLLQHKFSHTCYFHVYALPTFPIPTRPIFFDLLAAWFDACRVRINARFVWEWRNRNVLNIMSKNFDILIKKDIYNHVSGF